MSTAMHSGKGKAMLLSTISGWLMLYPFGPSLLDEARSSPHGHRIEHRHLATLDLGQRDLASSDLLTHPKTFRDATQNFRIFRTSSNEPTFPKSCFEKLSGPSSCVNVSMAAADLL